MDDARSPLLAASLTKARDRRIYRINSRFFSSYTLSDGLRGRGAVSFVSFLLFTRSLFFPLLLRSAGVGLGGGQRQARNEPPNRHCRGSARVNRLCGTSRSLGQVPAQTGKAQSLPRRKTTLVVIIRTSNRKETGTQGVASLGRGIGAGLFPEAQPRGTTPRVGNRCIVADGSKS